MAILIDVLFAAMLLGFVAVGLRFGLIRSLLGFLGSLVSLIGAVVLGNLLAGWMYTGVFRGPMVDQISKVVSEQGGVVQTQTESALSALPGFIGNALQNFGVSARQVGQAVAASADPLAQSVADYVSPVVIHLTALVLTFLIFLLLRTGIFFLIRLLVARPAYGQPDWRRGIRPAQRGSGGAASGHPDVGHYPAIPAGGCRADPYND